MPNELNRSDRAQERTLRACFSHIFQGAPRVRQNRNVSPRLESLEPRTLLSGLLHQADLSYLGAFNVPKGSNGRSTFAYGGTALAYNPEHNSLFMVGHDWQQHVGEVSVPPLHTGPVDKLATAKVLQPLTPLLPRIPNNHLGNGVKIGGFMVDGGQLIGTAYEYYDAGRAAIDSHFKLSSLNLGSASVSGLYQVGKRGGGFVGGYMAEVPPRWQDQLGAPYLTGQAALSIISRTSSGPAAFGFDPAQLGRSVTPATPLVEYPLAHPLGPQTKQNRLFNMTTEIRGMVFPAGTDSVLFIGSHGVGPYWYGEATEGGIDPYRPAKGPHAPHYVYQVWAYDVHGLIAAKKGLLKPWEVRPYDTWQFDLPYFEGGKHIGGVAFDSASGRLYVSQQYGNGAYPVIHAYQFSVDVPNRNDAPLLNAALNPRLASIWEHSRKPVGTQVARLLVDAVKDPDPGALRGIAVTAASTFHGTWKFSLDGGGSWQTMGTPTKSAARLLPGWAQVRFLPRADFWGTVKLYYHAWDQTQGVAGGTFNLVGNSGGAKSLSLTKDSAALTVIPINNVQLRNLSGSIGVRHDAAVIAIAPYAVVTAVDSTNFANVTLRVRVTNGAVTFDHLAIGFGFSVRANNNILLGTTIIGKRISNGFGTNELVITFNSYATKAIVQKLVRSITFKTVGEAAGQRKVVFTVSGSDGGSSAEVFKTVNVT